MRKFIQHIFTLKENTDFENTTRVISEGVSLRGYNLWILVCAAMLASLGLDTNSTAVIIGAMLISPLMSPILGVGLSLAIHDTRLLTRSLRNLLIAVVLSLIASVLYFLLSPLGEPTSELQARTFPTLLDVLIALFGGIAGIVSISRQQPTNAIPGVAIATALMPPLCTAGFGIATTNWNYFLGAFYLFFINAVFISMATYLIVRYLQFPEKEFAQKGAANKYRRWFVILGVLALSPSIYFLYTVYQKAIIKKEIDNLVILPIKNQGNEVLRWEMANRDSMILIKVYHSGKAITDSMRVAIDSALSNHRLGKYHLMSMRVNLTKEEVSQLSSEMVQQMFQELHLEELREQSIRNNTSSDTIVFHDIQKEVNAAFPFINTVSNAWLLIPGAKSNIDTMPVIFYKAKGNLTRAQASQLYNYLVARLRVDTVVVIKQ